MSQLKKALDQSASPALFKQRLNIRGADAGTDTANFGGILSSADDTVQKALDTIDDIFGADVSISGDLTLTDTDAGAGSGPLLSLYRNSPSPAANDALGQIEFFGENSAGSKIQYTTIRSHIADPSSGSEDAYIIFSARIAGSVAAQRVAIGHGLYTWNATDGDKGADTINASAIYDDGVLLKNVSKFESSAQTLSASSTVQVAHGLGAEPDNVAFVIECTTADANYSIGDRVILHSHVVEGQDIGEADQGITAIIDSTNVTAQILAQVVVPDKSSLAATPITMGSWELYIRAFLY